MLLLTYISLEMWFENQGTDKARCNVKSRFKEKKPFKLQFQIMLYECNSTM